MNLKEELQQVEAELARLEERKRRLYELSVQAPEHEKLCENGLAEMLAEPELVRSVRYPIEVTGIHFAGGLGPSPGLRKCGLVRVRPCAEEFEGKTFLGLYIGDLARSVECSYNRQSGVLQVSAGHENPAIWIPSRERLVFGYESWWGPLKSEDQLREITSEQIDGIWYVQALKALVSGVGAPGEGKWTDAT